MGLTLKVCAEFDLTQRIETYPAIGRDEHILTLNKLDTGSFIKNLANEGIEIKLEDCLQQVAFKDNKPNGNTGWVPLETRFPESVGARPISYNFKNDKLEIIVGDYTAPRREERESETPRIGGTCYGKVGLVGIISYTGNGEEGVKAVNNAYMALSKMSQSLYFSGKKFDMKIKEAITKQESFGSI